MLLPLVNEFARRQNKGVLRIFRDGDLWIHQTTFGYFAYHEPYIRLDMQHFDEMARANFFWGCELRAGDVAIDVGAGAGEETLTFSRAVGPNGKVVSIEGHPRTFRCLEAMVRYNRPENVVACIERLLNRDGRSPQLRILRITWRIGFETLLVQRFLPRRWMKSFASLDSGESAF